MSIIKPLAVIGGLVTVAAIMHPQQQQAERAEERAKQVAISQAAEEVELAKSKPQGCDGGDLSKTMVPILIAKAEVQTRLKDSASAVFGDWFSSVPVNRNRQ
jgi:hypothetical protein